MNSHRAIPSDASDQLSHKNLFDSLGTSPIGLTVVVVKNEILMTPVRSAMTQQLLTAGSAIGLKFPAVKSVRSFHSGSDRSLQFVKARHDACGSPPNGVEHKFKSFGTRRNFDWCSNEGLAALLPLINPNRGLQQSCWYTVEQSEAGHAILMADAFQKFRHAAKVAEAYIMVFVFCKEGSESTNYDELCDDYIEVDMCEPDLNHDQAFSIDCQGLSGLYELGVGKTMCSISHEEGHIKHIYTKFIDASLRSRAMWILRGNGSSLAEIGEIVGRNKSNVLRTLKQLPRPRRTAVPDGWIEQIKEYLEVEESPKQRFNDEDEEDEEEDIG